MKKNCVLFLLLTLFSCGQDLNIVIDTNDEICVLDQRKYWEEPLADSIENSGCMLIKPNSKEMDEFAEWFEENESEWQSSSFSFAMPIYTFQYKKYKFRILKKLIVVNFEDEKGEPKQYIQEIDETDFNFLN